MKRWKFSLETVRTLKERLEEEAAKKHAEALLALAHSKALLAQTETQMSEAARSCLRGGTRAAGDLVRMNQYINALEKQREERRAACMEGEKQVALARAQLEKVAREREILDRLHDRRKREHEFHVGRQEQKWLDEMAQRQRGGLMRAA